MFFRKTVFILIVCTGFVFSLPHQIKASNPGVWSFLGSETTNYIGYASLAKGTGDTLYAGGDSGVAVWTGTVWKTIAKTPVKRITWSGGKLFVSGSFSSIGGTVARNIAQWDGKNWSSLGAGIGLTSKGSIRALKSAGNGLVYAGGDIDSAGSSPANNFATWNGTSWDTSGGGQFSGPVVAIACGDSGILYAAFGTTILKKTGATWSMVQLQVSSISGGPYFTYPLEIDAMAVGKDGSLYVAGYFPQVGNDLYYGGLLKWNGTFWKKFGTGKIERATDVEVSPSGKVFTIASDDFNYVGTYQNNLAIRYTVFAIRDSVADTCFSAAIGISTISSAVPMVQSCIAVENDSTVYINYGTGVTVEHGKQSTELRSGLFEFGTYGFGKITGISCGPQKVFIFGRDIVYNGSWLGSLAMWDGAAWTSLGAGTTFIGSIRATADGGLLAAGPFDSIGGIPATADSLDANHLEHGAKWLNGAWTPVAQWEFPGVIKNVDGSYFRTDSTATHGAKNILKRNGTRWDTIGTCTIDTLRWGTGSYLRSNPNPSVRSIAVLPDGSLVAAGRFDFIKYNGVQTSCNNIARWTGSAWVSLDLPATLSDNTDGNNMLLTIAITKTGGIVASAPWLSSTIPPATSSSRYTTILLWQNNAWSILKSANNYYGPADVVCDSSGIPFTDFTDNTTYGGISFYSGQAWTTANWLQQPAIVSVTNLTLAPDNSIDCIGYDNNGHYSVINYSYSKSSIALIEKPRRPDIVKVSCISRIVRIQIPGAQAGKPLTLTVYSMNGQIIKRVFLCHSKETMIVPFPGIPAGLYAIAVEFGRESYSSKFLITH